MFPHLQIKLSGVGQSISFQQCKIRRRWIPDSLPRGMGVGGVSKSSPVPRKEAEGIPMRRVRSLGLVLSDSVY